MKDFKENSGHIGPTCEENQLNAAIASIVEKSNGNPVDIMMALFRHECAEKFATGIRNNEKPCAAH